MISVDKVQVLSQISEEKLTIKFAISGTEYTVQMQPAKETVEDVALEFCKTKIAEFGLSKSTIHDLCIIPVSEVIQDAVVKNSRDPPISSMDIDGEDDL